MIFCATVGAIHESPVMMNNEITSSVNRRAQICHPERYELKTETETLIEGSPASNRLQIRTLAKDILIRPSRLTPQSPPSRCGSVTLAGKQRTVLFSNTLVPLRYPQGEG